MCTVTYYPIDNEFYILSTNRDELKARAKATPPQVNITDEVRFVRPVDGEKGGTWIAVNEYKLSLNILNWFQAYDQRTDYKSDYYSSRGQIIHDLISSKTLEECNKRLKTIDLEHFAPFRLLGFQVNPLKIIHWSWDGKDLKQTGQSIKPHIWISAGFDYTKVLRLRKEAFSRFLDEQNPLTIEGIKKLHASQYPEKGHFAISMSHERAQSVSNTIIDVQKDCPVMYYLDGFPAESQKWTDISLPGGKNTSAYKNRGA